MTETKAIVAMIVGCVAIVLAFTSKHFYAARGLNGGGSGKEIPRWQGQLLFLVVGTVFLLAGISFFVRDL